MGVLLSGRPELILNKVGAMLTTPLQTFKIAFLKVRANRLRANMMNVCSGDIVLVTRSAHVETLNII